MSGAGGAARTAWRHTRVLARKNMRLKGRQYCRWSCGCCPCTVIWELLMPVGIIVLFSYLRGLSDASSTLGGWEVIQSDFILEKRQQVRGPA
jgi:hypothetical protein